MYVREMDGQDGFDVVSYVGGKMGPVAAGLLTLSHIAV